jgi:hypothetical protein
VAPAADRIEVILVYARVLSQLVSNEPSQWSGLEKNQYSIPLKAQNFAHQRPWIVHESTGPVGGEVSQNLYSAHQSISLHFSVSMEATVLCLK